MTKSSKARVDRRKRNNNAPAPDAVIRLTDAAALRAFSGLSDDATLFLNGMLKVTTRTGRPDACLAEAWAQTQLTRSTAVAAIRELQASGLLRQSDDGVVILHRVFSSLAHSFHRISNGNSIAHTGGIGTDDDDAHSIGDVIAFTSGTRAHGTG